MFGIIDVQSVLLAETHGEQYVENVQWYCRSPPPLHPERWADFDRDNLSGAEQEALLLLVASGLVERRIGVRGEFAGQAPAIEFTIDATGEYGVVEVLDPVVAELWMNRRPTFEAWKASDAKDSTPSASPEAALNAGG